MNQFAQKQTCSYDQDPPQVGHILTEKYVYVGLAPTHRACAIITLHFIFGYFCHHVDDEAPSHSLEIYASF